jgi:hypothetical protein
VPVVIRRYVACLLAVAWLAAAAAPARAQSGLYVPFPTGPSAQAKHYLTRLGPSGQRAALSLSKREIKAGAFLGGAASTPERAASRRAGRAPDDGPGWPAQLLFLLLPFGAVVGLATRT